jgi:NAD(P)-dependent dehydrogenase (short-subunit alcohol dehydrogenase family)
MVEGDIEATQSDPQPELQQQGQQQGQEEQGEEEVTREEVDTACRVLQYFSRHPQLYSEPQNRALRASLQPLFDAQKEKMFGGGGLSCGDYHADKSAKERRKQEKNRIKLENERLLKLTTLRAGRIRRLENLKEGTSDDIALVMDGVAEDGVNSTALHADRPQLLKDSPENDSDSLPKTLKYATNSFRSCYICKRRFQDLHHFYDSLCPSCAQMNWKKRLQTCDMRNKVCLVTGGRVKIGFQCCLKLLRCGATVIATSRFPCDTAKRFAAQADYAEWSSRIHVFGLDLRDLAYVEAFCDMTMARFSHIDVIVNNACQTIRRPRAYYSHLIADEEDITKACLQIKEKGPDAVNTGSGSVDSEGLLSMLTDDLSYRDMYIRSTSSTHAAISNEEARVIVEDEEGVSDSPADSLLNVSSGDKAGGKNGVPLSSAELSQVPLTTDDLVQSNTALLFPTEARDVNNQQIDLRKKHSWLLRMHEVSTPEVAEVFAINSISPFVMISRLKPALTKTPLHAEVAESNSHENDAPHVQSLAEYILNEERVKKKQNGKSGDSKSKKGEKPPAPYCKGGVSTRVHHADCSFIVNVSSMEGKFYRRKMEAHPHTNMAKAALNMMTRTAADDYKNSNIFMTAVDTGWINDENPLEKAAEIAQNHNFATPLDEVDAAARILDPVLYPLRKGEESSDGACRPFYGCFLKDYFLSEW